ncbi:MAG TPA: hypothetical protein VKH81_21855 [Candidatus Angelobacter sp.]|nr:hypothetical protein [Candidatus Angelobacter sp.]
MIRSNLAKSALVVAFATVMISPGTSGSTIAPEAAGPPMFCDEPGTPNNESVTSTAPRTLTYSFDNTARVSADSHPGGYLKMNMYFDINMKEAGTPDSQEWTYIENDGPHPLGYRERMSYPIRLQETRHINPANMRQQHVDRPLQANKSYCMRVWSRVTGGCRSRVSSSWKCGRVNP